MVDNGYDISNFEKINPDFGTFEDLEKLIATAKKLNIKVMLDLVINHTSDEHKWFQEALKDPNSKYRNYYIFKSGINGKRPNNWRSLFGGSVWEKVPNEDTYYFHVFHKKQPDLNWENPDLRKEIYAMINRWLDKGISGFRLDSITFLKKDQQFKSLPADGEDGLVSCTKGSRNQPGLNVFLNELNNKIFAKRHCVTVGEAPGVPYSQFSDFIGDDGYFSMIFDFHYADIDVESGSEWWRRTSWTVKEFKKLLFKSQTILQSTGWGANFIENHDQPRSISKYIRNPQYQNAIGAEALGAMYFFLRGTPFIYQGQELGMRNFKRMNIDEFNDVSSLDNYKRARKIGFTDQEALNFINLRSRDNTRTPYPWDDSENGGFTSGKPWLKPTNEPNKINFKNEIVQENSVFNFYRKMILIRNHSKNSHDLIYGSIKELDNVPDDVVAYKRVGRNRYYSYTNLSAQLVSFQIPEITSVLLNNYQKTDIKDNLLKLQPYQTILLRKEG